MAHDKDQKIKIRAFYECNDYSYAKVAEHFAGIGVDVSKKTLEHWGREEGWVKNRYASMESAIEDLLPPETFKLMTEATKQKVIQSMVTDAGEALTPDEVDQMAMAVSDELTHQVLARRNLSGLLAKNLHNASAIAANSVSMPVLATFHNMVLQTVQTVYGKKVELLPPSGGVGAIDEEIKTMSTEDLIRLLETT